jgi:hypothetical protein
MLVVAGVKTKPPLPTSTLAVAAELEKAPPKQDKPAIAMAAKKDFDEKGMAIRR